MRKDNSNIVNKMERGYEMVITKDLLYELAYLYRIRYIDVETLLREVVDEINLDSLYKQIWTINENGEYKTKKIINDTKEYETIIRSKFTEKEERIIDNIEKELRKKLKKDNRLLPKSPFLEDILRNIDDRLTLRLLYGNQIYVKGLAEPVYYDHTLKDYIITFGVNPMPLEVKTNQRKICRVRLSNIACCFTVVEKAKTRRKNK